MRTLLAPVYRRIPLCSCHNTEQFVRCGLLGIGIAGLARTVYWIQSQRRALGYVLPELRNWRCFLPLSAGGPLRTYLITHLFSKPTPLPTNVTLQTLIAPSLPPDNVASTALRQVRALCGSDVEKSVPVPLRQYLPQTQSGHVNGVILWFHGGGYISGSYLYKDAYCGRLAADTGCMVLSAEYRLAPRDPFPRGFLDCIAALFQASKMAKERDIPLIISGVSAGGGLAAATAQFAADAKIPVDLQALVYPMLDPASGWKQIKHEKPLGNFVWTRSANRYGWNSYLYGNRHVRLNRWINRGNKTHIVENTHMSTRGMHSRDIWRYAIPGVRQNLTGLAPAWIGCGDLDLFYPECRTYVKRLQACGVPTQFHTVQGMYHGGDAAAPDAPAIRAFYDSMIDAIRETIRSREVCMGT